MAEIESENSSSNGVIRHSRTSSSTSSTCSTEDGLVLSVAGLHPSAGCKPRRPNSGNNNNSASSENANLRAELELVKSQLKTKDEEVNRLSKIRDELENEVQELTASLFEEAHKMVGEANIKAAGAERSLEEASMKIEGLETEVAALKDLVLTSTPSKPNRHLHPQIDHRKAKATSNAVLEMSSSSCNSSYGGGLEDMEKWVDPVVKKEYMNWKKTPNLDKSSSQFLQRLFHEDIVPCLTFPNEHLAIKVMKAVEDNAISMSPIVIPKETSGQLPKLCALFEAPLICQFKVILGNAADPDVEDHQEFEISQLARNRVAAACECINYLRYICEGLVKAHHNEVYWEIVKRRKKMILAKLGYWPDQD